jgi:alpha-tubulin suppressor-like RCC1 family protein
LAKVQVGGVGPNDYSLALTKDGDVYSWGKGSYGELGLGKDHRHSLEPAKINLSGVKNIFGGGWHSFAITHSNRLYGFGYNGDGRCGVGHFEIIWEPQEVVSMIGKRVVMAANGCFSALLTDDGKVYTTGGSVSNLGHGTSEYATTGRFELVKGFTSCIKEIAAGVSHFVALDGKNIISCCVKL